MAFLYRRLVRIGLTLAVATAAGLAAPAFAAKPEVSMAEPLAVAASPSPRVVGQDIRRNAAITLGQRLVAGPGSGIALRLGDGTSVVIGPNSVLSVDEFAADRIVLRLERGSFHVDSANPGLVHVILPSGTVGLRAAAVAGRIGPDHTDIVLLSPGRVDVAGFGGRSVRLDRQGLTTRIQNLGSPSKPVLLPAERLKDFTGLVAQVAMR